MGLLVLLAWSLPLVYALGTCGGAVVESYRRSW